jgi:hypothetical protein
MSELTPKEQKLYDYLVAFYSTNGHMPSTIHLATEFHCDVSVMRKKFVSLMKKEKLKVIDQPVSYAFKMAPLINHLFNKK